MNAQTNEVKLRTIDGKKFILTKSQALCSNALREMITSSRSRVSEYIDIQNVDSQVLSKVIEWCQKHCDGATQQDEDTTTICGRNKITKLSAWETEFLNAMSEEEFLQVTHAANYLDVRTLFDCCCHLIAKKWEGKKVEEIRQMYNIKSDFDPEEEYLMLQDTKKLGLEH